MRKQTRVTVFNEEQYDGEWPPTGAIEFVAWFAEKLAEIPREFLSCAKVEIDSRTSFDSHFAGIEIYYDRPETNDEIASREAEERRNQESRMMGELQMLAALKAKYGA